MTKDVPRREKGDYQCQMRIGLYVRNDEIKKIVTFFSMSD